MSGLLNHVDFGYCGHDAHYHRPFGDHVVQPRTSWEQAILEDVLREHETDLEAFMEMEVKKDR